MPPAFGSLMHPVISVVPAAALELSRLRNFAVARLSAASSLLTSALGVLPLRLAAHDAALVFSFNASQVIRSWRQAASNRTPANRPAEILMVPSCDGSHLP